MSSLLVRLPGPASSACAETRTLALTLPKTPGIGTVEERVVLAAPGSSEVERAEEVPDSALVGPGPAPLLPPGGPPILTAIGTVCTWAECTTDGITNSRALSWRGGGREKLSMISDIAC